MSRTPSDKAGPSDAVRPTTAPTSPAPTGKKGRGRLSNRVKDARASIDVRKRTLLERAAREREKHESVRALFHLFEEDKGRGGGLLAGGLAYRLFIWLLPAALVASSLLRLVSDLGGESPSSTAKDLGMGAAVTTSVNRAATQTGRAAPVLLVVGLVIMLWAARGVLKALRLVSAIAWEMGPAPLRSPIRPTLATAGLLIVFPVYGIAVGPLYGGSLAGDVVATLLAITGMVAIVTWATGTLPRPDGVGRLDLVPGAILFAAGIEALRLATTLYFANKLERVDDLYGALGLAAVFMTYLYLLARLAVVSLMANAAMWRSGLSRLSIKDL
ncbi:MAG: YhjD/YihY/BrkB family envelope integrity protein [Actinomycetota bacterium]